MPALKFSNRNGFPCLESIGANLTTTALTYNFNSHPYQSNNFYGGIFIKIQGTPTAPTPAVPVYFNTTGVNGSNIAVLNAQGIALTTADITDGIYLAFYDRDDNKLYILNI